MILKYVVLFTLLLNYTFPGSDIQGASRGDPDQDRRCVGGVHLQGGPVHHQTGDKKFALKSSVPDENLMIIVLILSDALTSMMSLLSEKMEKFNALSEK